VKDLSGFAVNDRSEARAVVTRGAPIDRSWGISCRASRRRDRQSRGGSRPTAMPDAGSSG
jgi:hypothetical protein